LKEFSNTIDERIESASVHFDELLTNLDAAQLKMIAVCSIEENDLNLCKNSMLNIKNECMKIELKDIPSCNDPRIQMILDKESDTSSTSGQIPSYDELHYADAEVIRDCSRETEIFAEDYMSKIIDLDAISENQEETIQSNVEKISICSANIREIEAREYGSGSVIGYWELMPKLQSLFDQVCSNTGKFCGYTFHGP
jgi:hypothetical protein